MFNEEEFIKMKKKALAEHIPIIMDDTLEVIKNILQETNPNKILEIGTAVGYSATCFAKFTSDTCIIDTIEIDEEKAKEAIENIQKIGVDKKIRIMIGNAIEILPTLTEEYDIIFIDAAKSKYTIFLKESMRLIKNQGIILADNILYKGYVMGEYHKHKQRTAVRHLREYIQQVTENSNLKTNILEVGDGLAISKVIQKN